MLDYLRVILLALAVCVTGCVTTGSTGRLPPAAASAEGALGPSDVVEIRLLQEAELSGSYQIDASGNLGFPYVGTVRVAGMTPEGVAEELQKRLRDGGFFLDPDVTVLVQEFNSRLVYVLGSVRNPGSYRYTDGMGVIDAISAAGGVIETGQPGKTTVTRKVDGTDYSVQVAVPAIVSGRRPDQLLAVGDIVFVPESPI
ncbi:MAG: polysaccharide export protein [Deltaproteobacteria bacterium]|nr:polysaccharide export protein [Deltaproteobacteria bacterium]